MDSCRNYSRHILNHRHPLRIHNHSAANGIGGMLQFCRGTALGVEHDAVGFCFCDDLSHPAEVIFRTSAFIPRVIGDKETASVSPGIAAQLPQAGGSAGQIPVEIPLVAVIETQARPGGPYAVDVYMAEEPVILIKVLSKSLFSAQAVVVLPVPGHLEYHQVAGAYPLQVFSLVECLVEPFQVIEPSLCEHKPQPLLPFAPEEIGIDVISHRGTRREYCFVPACRTVISFYSPCDSCNRQIAIGPEGAESHLPGIIRKDDADGTLSRQVEVCAGKIARTGASDEGIIILFAEWHHIADSDSIIPGVSKGQFCQESGV